MVRTLVPDVESSTSDPPRCRPHLILIEDMVAGGCHSGVVGPAHDQPVINDPMTGFQGLPTCVVRQPTLPIPLPVHPVYSCLRRRTIATQDALPRRPIVARHSADGERGRDAGLRPQQLRGRGAADGRHRVHCPVTRRSRSRNRPRLA